MAKPSRRKPAGRAPRPQARPRGAREPVRIGIIGGSGLYAIEGLTDTREVRVRTPFGAPSDAFVVGTLESQRVAFLARHGRGHRLLPTEINFRANLYGMKLLGVERIFSASAVGSLREDLPPGTFLIPDQFFDRTRHRADTFFGDGLVAHISFDTPTCGQLSGTLADACEAEQVGVYRGGTYVCMEGPQFSTLAESHVYRQLRFDVVGMTNLAEARLAREAEICYATMAMVTDYDCWHPGHDAVTVKQILAVLRQNAQNAHRVLRRALRSLPAERSCRCGHALEHAVLTDRKAIPAHARRRLAAITAKYLG